MTRIEAARLRLKIYRGNPCAKGHEGLRYTRSGGCVQCARETSVARHEEIRKLLAGDAA